MSICDLCGSKLLSTGVCGNPMCSSNNGNSRKDTVSEIEKVAINTSGSVTYDEHAKRMFASREVLSYLVHTVIEDISTCWSRENIYSLLGYKTIKEAMDADKPLYVEQCNSESGRVHGKKIIYDVLTTIPYSNDSIDMCYVNVEMQNNEEPGYVLQHRALAYFARLIDDSINMYKGNSSYTHLRKVYGIWVVRTKGENRIERYYINEQSAGRDNNMNFMEIVFIYFNGEKDGKNDEGLLQFMYDLLVERDIEKKRTNLSKVITLDSYIEKEMTSMCNLSKGLVQEGIEEGRALEKKDMIISLFSNNVDIEVIALSAKMSKLEVHKILNDAGLLNK